MSGTVASPLERTTRTVSFQLLSGFGEALRPAWVRASACLTCAAGPPRSDQDLKMGDSWRLKIPSALHRAHVLFFVCCFIPVNF